jgi:hypothetical protein
VYQTVRYNLNGYRLTVPDGTYAVTLQFNEPHYAEAGKRVFGAKIQGRQVLTNLDIFAKVGQNRALDFSFPDTAVTNGTLRIEFTRETEYPCIAGIVIAGQTKAANQLASEPFNRKINCGGDQVAGYEADRVGDEGMAAARRNRAMPIEDFYLDFARANFGDALAEPAGKILARLDGVQLPQISDWKTGPGDLSPIRAPWSEVRKKYAFVDELATLRAQIKTPGNRERFDYWLNTYRAMAAMAEASCIRGQLDQAMTAEDYPKALAARLELAKTWQRLLSLQTALVSTPGELGTIANLERHTRRHARFLESHDDALEKALGGPLPAEAQPGKDYTGPARIIVPTVRSIIRQGEALKLPVIVLDQERPKKAALHFRRMGHGKWRELPLKHVGRAVYSVELPGAQEAMEYYLTAETVTGQQLAWPATAPKLNQTLVPLP